jgi:hypothetical protein
VISDCAAQDHLVADLRVRGGDFSSDSGTPTPDVLIKILSALPFWTTFVSPVTIWFEPLSRACISASIRANPQSEIFFQNDPPER